MTHSWKTYWSSRSNELLGDRAFWSHAATSLGPAEANGHHLCCKFVLPTGTFVCELLIPNQGLNGLLQLVPLVLWTWLGNPPNSQPSHLRLLSFWLRLSALAFSVVWSWSAFHVLVSESKKRTHIKVQTGRGQIFFVMFSLVRVYVVNLKSGLKPIFLMRI